MESTVFRLFGNDGSIHLVNGDDIAAVSASPTNGKTFVRIRLKKGGSVKFYTEDSPETIIDHLDPETAETEEIGFA